MLLCQAVWQIIGCVLEMGGSDVTEGAKLHFVEINRVHLNVSHIGLDGDVSTNGNIYSFTQQKFSQQMWKQTISKCNNKYRKK